MSKKTSGVKNAWGVVKTAQHGVESFPGGNKKNGPGGQTKFAEVQQKHLEAAKKLAETYESSSDEEDVSTTEIFESVLKGYSGDSGDLRRTHQFLENAFQSGAATCLICIGGIKRVDSIWSCVTCYCFFHLACIQRWANDNIGQKRLRQADEASSPGFYTNRGEFVPRKITPITWDCPQCRHSYGPEEVPRRYLCFCGKEDNPQVHPWLIPHSCGELCQRPLEPVCGHKCLLLCHPGPCPPCPQTISQSCECGKSAKRTIRCSTKSWRCQDKCQKILSCGVHKCNQICHSPDSCKPCSRRSVHRCQCGQKQEERNCSESVWQCATVCGKEYSCGRHRCEKRCHPPGECGDCPQGLPRSCPCGKQTSVAPCSEQIDTCGDSCLKQLPCGDHLCLDRCHRGECGACPEIIEKRCRCGLHSKQLPCHKSFTCETKCKQQKDCTKHVCNRKCCDGNCPPCDKICGKTLPCGRHKCKSNCHTGHCYPCNLKAKVKCRCSKTVIEVPCGRERKTRPPKCHLPCRRPSKCHHDNPHNCHQDDCPTCTKKCGLFNDTTKCAHPCEAKCHDAVLVRYVDKNWRPAGPWDVQPEVTEITRLPHPKCEIRVPVSCLGGHETIPWPCHDAIPRSCGRSCGRELKCGNHKCEKECHPVKDLQLWLQQEACDECREGCKRKRPQGCSHPCKKPCHSDPCDPCTVATKTACHCGLTQVIYRCGEFFASDDPNAKETQLSCGNRCIKNYPCGHRCTSTCHSGQCPDPESCKKKVKTTCKCKTKKIEVTCEKLRSGTFVLACDEQCSAKMAQKAKELEEKMAKQREEEAERNRQELEEFERKFGKKKPKERKRREIVDEKGTNWKLIAGSAVMAIVIAVAVYIFLFNTQ
ncbi:NF-X1-type zinc finger protein NFXL1 [Phlebotomus papatasi]|uniref:NF-X1-type zinc finger protein NFXL1 n=1 Tax=Phlebotomus papatasi TaxID=29031 RepID=UPI002483F4DC|nr:NF-X1-type zinc finger protein NFXL1 [Phlebotomus papatasi]